MKKRREKEIKKLISREYRLYKEEEQFRNLPKTMYEKACKTATGIIKVDPDKKSRKKLEETIQFAHLRVTPTGVASLTMTFAVFATLPLIFLMLLGFFGLPGLPFGFGIMFLVLALFFTLYIHTYPSRLKRKYETEAGADIVTFVLYIAMYLRNVPNLESAVKFAAENIDTTLGYEIKKLLWDVELGTFLSMEDALTDYTKRWKKNRSFVEAVELTITSLKQVGQKRIELLDEAVDKILDGSREEARHFNQNLKMPVMVVHALGVILPIMGLVLFPIVAVFLGVSSVFLFVGYDIMLPLILYFVITNILETRPPTFSKIDITENPNVPPPGKFKMGKKDVRAWPIGLVIGIVLISFGLLLYLNEAASGTPEGILPAVTVGFGFSLSFGIYYILLSKQRMKVREKVRKIEGEFAEALFQLGSQISGGIPIELSIEHSMERIKNLTIKDLFQRALRNMKMLGFTFAQAFFDKQYGAIRYYPSKLIKSIMKTVVESTRKGVRTAAVAMLSISKYLKGLHDTQEEVKGELSDTLNSLRFQAYFLSPMISGVVVTLAIIIMRILGQIGERVTDLGNVNVPFLSSFADVAITPFEFIAIVSIYLIETAFILSMFINSIENGEDPIGRQNTTGYALVMGYTVFVGCMILTLAMFGPLITSILG